MAKPIVNIPIREFLFDLEQTKTLKWKTERDFDFSYRRECVSFEEFVGVLKEKEKWAPYVTDDNNNLMKMLRVDEMFMIIDERNGMLLDVGEKKIDLL